MSNPYDDLAPVYDRWIIGDASCTATHQFYVNWLAGVTGRIVEGGVGTGRIAIDLARRGQSVIGIDISDRMLAIARKRARSLGLGATLTLRRMDLRRIGLRDIDVFYLPFRTIGHFITREERQHVFSQIFASLVPGGRFIFDHYVPDLAWARKSHDRPQRMFSDSRAGQALEIWDTYLFDFEHGLLDCNVEIRSEDSAPSGGEPPRSGTQKVSFTFSWLAPEEVRELAAATGFDVLALYGDFEAGPFTPQSEQQIWVLSRPLPRVRCGD